MEPHRARPLAPRGTGVVATACATALLVLGLLAPRAEAQFSARIGFVDSQKLFEQYPVARDAQERFNREVQQWREDADERRKQLDVLRNELKDQGPMLSEERRVEKESALARATSDYDRFVQEFWGPGGRVQRANDEMTREVIGKIRDAVELLANREGYDLILDAADGNVIFGVAALDLTSRVLDELNKNLPAGSPSNR
jgi:Skp family chaperone for outer membrane proteins